MTGAPSLATGHTKAERTNWQIAALVIRRGLAGLLLLGGTALLIFDKVPDLCGEQVAEATAVTVCQSVSLTDPRLVAWLLLIVALLLPDLSEIELAGVFTLKRAVEEVREDTEKLRGEVAQLQVTASTIAQQSQNVTLNVGERLGAGYASFQSEVNSGDAGALTSVEEVGAYAHLAFHSALTGLISEVFGTWQGRGISLIGWVPDENGELASTYIVGPDVDENVADAAREGFQDDPSSAPSFSSNDDFLAVTAAAVTDPAITGTEKLVGALSVVMATRNDDDPSQSDLVSLAAGAEAAAGAYALLLTRILGEPSTL